MRIVRFILPFLFVRNWYDGSWEFSRARLILVSMGLFFIVLGIIIAAMLQSPVVYISPTL